MLTNQSMVFVGRQLETFCNLKLIIQMPRRSCSNRIIALARIFSPLLTPSLHRTLLAKRRISGLTLVRVLPWLATSQNLNTTKPNLFAMRLDLCNEMEPLNQGILQFSTVPMLNLVSLKKYLCVRHWPIKLLGAFDSTSARKSKISWHTFVF